MSKGVDTYWDAWLLVARFLEGPDLLRLECVSQGVRFSVRDAEPAWRSLFWRHYGEVLYPESWAAHQKLPACFAHAFDHVPSWRWLWMAHAHRLSSGFLDDTIVGSCTVDFVRDTETVIYIGNTRDGLLDGYGTMFVCGPSTRPRHPTDRLSHPLARARVVGWSEAMWMGDSRYITLGAFNGSTLSPTVDCAERETLWQRLVACPMDAVGRSRICTPSTDPRAASLLVLPDEVLVSILERAPPVELVLARASCQRLKGIVDGYDSIWFEAFLRDVAPHFAQWMADTGALVPSHDRAGGMRAAVRQCFSHAGLYLQEGKVWQWLYLVHSAKTHESYGAPMNGAPCSVNVARLDSSHAVRGSGFFFNLSPYLDQRMLFTYHGAIAAWAAEDNVWVPQGYGLVTIRSPHSCAPLAHLQVWCTCSDVRDPKCCFQVQVLTYTWSNGCRYVMDPVHPSRGITTITSAVARGKGKGSCSETGTLTIKGRHENGIATHGSTIYLDNRPYIYATDKGYIYFWGGPDDPCRLIINTLWSESTSRVFLLVVTRDGNDVVAVLGAASNGGESSQGALIYYTDGNTNLGSSPKSIGKGDPALLADLVAKVTALENVPAIVGIMCDRYVSGEHDIMEDDETAQWVHGRIIPAFNVVVPQMERMEQVCRRRMPIDIVRSLFG